METNNYGGATEEKRFRFISCSIASGRRVLIQPNTVFSPEGRLAPALILASKAVELNEDGGGKPPFPTAS
jgi:hypothetical protein